MPAAPDVPFALGVLDISRVHPDRLDVTRRARVRLDPLGRGLGLDPEREPAVERLAAERRRGGLDPVDGPERLHATEHEMRARALQRAVGAQVDLDFPPRARRQGHE
jgi:hypothetical protein